jgi:hypothetical protein
MKKFVTFASNLRVHALLCCSATVLLTACGGGNDINAPQQASQAAVLTKGEAMPPSGGAAVAPAGSDVNATMTSVDSAMTAAVLTVSPSIYNLYVATTGSDSNPGSITRPFRTIQHAASLVKPSTTVHVAAGTYYGNVSTSVSGSATARIRYVSDTKWGAKVIGTGTEFMWTNRGNYTDIVGFDISGSGREGILNLASYTLMQSNHVHNLTISGGCGGGGGAGINNGDYTKSDNDIIGNVVHDIGVPGKCNTIQGIYAANLRGKIHNNIVYRVSSWGISLWHAATKMSIANNTVFQNGGGSMGGGIFFGTGDGGATILTDTKVVNNIVYKNPAKGIYGYCTGVSNCWGTGNIVANNLVSGNGTSITVPLASSPTSTITADPQFVNYQANGTGDYRLKSTSPAVNKGTTISAPTYDMDFIARPRGVANDIGAYESF